MCTKNSFHLFTCLISLIFFTGCLGDKKDNSPKTTNIVRGRPAISDNQMIKNLEKNLVTTYGIKFEKIEKTEKPYVYKLKIPMDREINHLQLFKDLENLKMEVERYLDYYPPGYYDVPDREDLLKKITAIKEYLDSYETPAPQILDI